MLIDFLSFEIMENVLEKYSVARHRYIGKADLLVLESNETTTLVRYIANDVYYTHSFNTDELEIKKVSKGSNLGILSGI